MIKKYIKKVPIEAEQFDGSYEMINKYDIAVDPDGYYALRTLEGYLELYKGDWIVTYQDGSQFVIFDEDWKAEK